MIDQTQMYPTSISPLGLFQGIICNIHGVTGIVPGIFGNFVAKTKLPPRSDSVALQLNPIQFKVNAPTLIYRAAGEVGGWNF